MTKIVISACYGGFGLSREAYKALGIPWDEYGHGSDIPRDDPKLVECVESLGERANGKFADSRVVEIPDGVDWTIGEYDGKEWVAEKHDTWH